MTSIFKEFHKDFDVLYCISLPFLGNEILASTQLSTQLSIDLQKFNILLSLIVPLLLVGYIFRESFKDFYVLYCMSLPFLGSEILSIKIWWWVLNWALLFSNILLSETVPLLLMSYIFKEYFKDFNALYCMSLPFLVNEILIHQNFTVSTQLYKYSTI